MSLSLDLKKRKEKNLAKNDNLMNTIFHSGSVRGLSSLERIKQ